MYFCLFYFIIFYWWAADHEIILLMVQYMFVCSCVFSYLRQHHVADSNSLLPNQMVSAHRSNSVLVVLYLNALLEPFLISYGFILSFQISNLFLLGVVRIQCHTFARCKSEIIFSGCDSCGMGKRSFISYDNDICSMLYNL